MTDQAETASTEAAMPATLADILAAQPDDVVARIEVRDNGTGYPIDLLPKLMEPYVTTREKGTGLGLAIVRKVMEDHGGELRLLNGNAQENLCGARAILLFGS